MADLGAHIDSEEPEMPQRPRSEPSAGPPRLTSIRVDGPRAKGLNKKAIVAVAGGSAAVILVLASGTLSGDPGRKPAETRPLMSDPARPEMAKGALRNLPATYTEVQALTASAEPASAPPQLGAPLPGDIAAFAPMADEGHPASPSWSVETAGTPPMGVVDRDEQEAIAAKRSDLFFALRQQPVSADRSASGAAFQTQPPTSGAGSQRPTSVSPDQSGAQRALHPGAVICVSLVTELNSEAPGPVVAQVTQSVSDSATGRVTLIPQGARLIGEYRSASKYGQSRVAIIWSRLIMPDGAEIILDEIAADPSGAAGVTGRVDNHWLDVFGAAALGTMINVGVASTEEPQLTYGGIGMHDPVDQAVTNGVQRTASIVTNRVVDRSLAIHPTIWIEAGKRMTVIVTRRISL